jgi:glycerophosphoryl diester phosphodiesterase
MNNFIRKIGLIPAWINEFFHFCPLQRRRKFEEDLFFNIGHRGSPAREIENTIASFDRALREGANGIEIDLSMTKDGEVVLWHDWDPNDTVSVLRESGFEPFVKYKPHPPAIGSDSRQRISQINLDEFLDNFDYKLLNSDSSDSAGAEIPTLGDFFEWSKNKKRLRLVFFDIKCPHDECDLAVGILEKIKNLIDEYKPAFKVVMETSHNDVYRIMKENMNTFDYSLDIEPAAGIILDPTEYSAVKAAIDNKNRYAIALRPRKITVANWTTFRRIVRHDIKLRRRHNNNNPEVYVEPLICATVSKPGELKCLVKMGIGGIQTDFPDKLYHIARKYGRVMHPEDEYESQSAGYNNFNQSRYSGSN